MSVAKSAWSSIHFLVQASLQVMLSHSQTVKVWLTGWAL